MRGMDKLLCRDCLGPATVQVVDEHGVPAGTYCGADWQEHQALSDAITTMLEDAVAKLS